MIGARWLPAMTALACARSPAVATGGPPAPPPVAVTMVERELVDDVEPLVPAARCGCQSRSDAAADDTAGTLTFVGTKDKHPTLFGLALAGGAPSILYQAERDHVLSSPALSPSGAVAFVETDAAYASQIRLLERGATQPVILRTRQEIGALSIVRRRQQCALGGG